MDLLQWNQGMPKICVPIVERTREKILPCAETLRESVADLVEWRADFYEDLGDMLALEQTARDLKSKLGSKPLLFTIRTAAEGGEARLDFAEYEAILRRMACLPEIAFVDVEMFWGCRGAEEQPAISAADHCHGPVRKLVQDLREHVTVIGSYHDFVKTPSQREIAERLQAVHELGADIPKMAVTPQTRGDVLTLMQATMTAKKRLGQVPLITMSMGELGAVSRVAGESFGSAVTFGCIGKNSAPGQIDAEQLRGVLELLHTQDRKE